MDHLADILLCRLHKVKQTGPDSWVACCPAHDDRSPSLTVAERNAKVLLHCFAECSPSDVLAAVGLTFSDIYPEPPDTHHLQPERKPFPAHAVLECVAQEAAIVLLCASALRQGRALPPEDHERLCVAVGRIQAALDGLR